MKAKDYALLICSFRSSNLNIWITFTAGALGVLAYLALSPNASPAPLGQTLILITLFATFAAWYFYALRTNYDARDLVYAELHQALDNAADPDFKADYEGQAHLLQNPHTPTKKKLLVHLALSAATLALVLAHHVLSHAEIGFYLD